MDVFYTITARDTAHCNDRSKRHATLSDAIQAATDRIYSQNGTNEVIIMKSIKLVKLPKPNPMVDIEDLKESI